MEFLSFDIDKILNNSQFEILKDLLIAKKKINSNFVLSNELAIKIIMYGSDDLKKLVIEKKMIVPSDYMFLLILKKAPSFYSLFVDSFEISISLINQQSNCSLDEMKFVPSPNWISDESKYKEKYFSHRILFQETKSVFVKNESLSSGSKLVNPSSSSIVSVENVIELKKPIIVDYLDILFSPRTKILITNFEQCKNKKMMFAVLMTFSDFRICNETLFLLDFFKSYIEENNLPLTIFLEQNKIEQNTIVINSLMELFSDNKKNLETITNFLVNKKQKIQDFLVVNPNDVSSSLSFESKFDDEKRRIIYKLFKDNSFIFSINHSYLLEFIKKDHLLGFIFVKLLILMGKIDKSKEMTSMMMKLFIDLSYCAMAGNKFVFVD